MCSHTARRCVPTPPRQAAFGVTAPTFNSFTSFIYSKLQQTCTELKAESKISTWTYIRTDTHTFNGPLSRTTWVSRYQKGRTNLDFTEARDSEWQWHQLGRMQVCTSHQTDNHASTQPLSFLQAGRRMPFLPPNQQRQSTEGINKNSKTQT